MPHHVPRGAMRGLEILQSEPSWSREAAGQAGPSLPAEPRTADPGRSLASAALVELVRELVVVNISLTN